MTASFDLLDHAGDGDRRRGSFSIHGTIFVGEDRTRAMLLGQSNQAETGVLQELTGTYGTLTVAQDGQWHYFLADHQANVQALAAGQTVTDTFTVQVSDGRRHRDRAARRDRDRQQRRAGGVGCGYRSRDRGRLEHDADGPGQRLRCRFRHDFVRRRVPASLPPGVSYGAATPSFTLDPSPAAYQSLAVGETITVTVNYGVSDGMATTPRLRVSWTVTGSNDAPVVSGAVTGAATEDGAASTLSALANATDADTGSRFPWSRPGRAAAGCEL